MNPERMLSVAALLVLLASSAIGQTLFPANKAQGVNPDVQLKLTFSQPPIIGKSGKVRIFDAANDRLVDTLDLSIPPGPTERATGAALSAPYLALPYPYERGVGPMVPTNANTKPGTPSAGAEPTPNTPINSQSSAASPTASTFIRSR
jgi:hypothetical protein